MSSKSNSYNIEALLGLPRHTLSSEAAEIFNINDLSLGDAVSHVPTGDHGVLVGREGGRWLFYDTATGAIRSASAFVLQIEARTLGGARADRLRQIKRIHEAKKSK